MSGFSSTKASVKELTPLPIDFDIADGKSESETTSIFLFILKPSSSISVQVYPYLSDKCIPVAINCNVISDLLTQHFNIFFSRP